VTADSSMMSAGAQTAGCQRSKLKCPYYHDLPNDWTNLMWLLILNQMSIGWQFRPPYIGSWPQTNVQCCFVAVTETTPKLHEVSLG